MRKPFRQKDVLLWCVHAAFWLVVWDDKAIPFLDKCVPSWLSRLAACWVRFCLPVAAGSGPMSLSCHEGPIYRSNSCVRSLNSRARACAGSSRSSSVSACNGADRDWHSHRGVLDALTGSKHKHSAMRSLVMTGTANALPTAFFRLFCPVLVPLSGSATSVQSAGKPNSRSASVGLITLLF